MRQYEFKFNYTIYISRKNYFMDFIDSYGDVLDIVLRASLWTDMYRSRIVGLLCTPVVGGVAGVSTTTVG